MLVELRDAVHEALHQFVPGTHPEVWDSRDEFRSSRAPADDFVVPERTADAICSPLGFDDA